MELEWEVVIIFKMEISLGLRNGSYKFIIIFQLTHEYV